jgi:hypothetical protein
VFELTNNGGGSYTASTLHSFTNTGADGAYPQAGLIMDGSGDLFGTTNYGGTSSSGTVFELTNNGGGSYTASTLHRFTNTVDDGAYPAAGLIMHGSGDLFGTTEGGGTDDDGTVFETTTAVTPAFTGLSGPTISYGTATATLTGTLAAGATDVTGATVAVTINGTTQTTTTDASGDFSLNFSTAALGATGSPYTVAYSYAGGTTFNPATDTSTTLTVTKATPTVAVTDGGAYTGSAFTAAGTVNGAATLEGVGLTYTYYAGSSATDTPLAGPPTAAGTYTVVAGFAGSADYTAASNTATFSITPPAPAPTPTPTPTPAPALTTISGTVFRDYNADGLMDGPDVGLAGRTVYLDVAGTGTLAAGDPTAVTDADGNYTLTNAPAGTYALRVAPTVLNQDVGTAIAVTVSGTPLTAQNIALRPDSTVLPVAVSPNLFAATTANPTAAQAAGLYQAILGRAGSSAEVAATAQATTAAGLSQFQLAETFLHSTEYLDDLVANDYRTYLGRAPDAPGETYWVGRLQSGATPEQVAIGFITSAEFAADHPDATGFVQALFQDVLGRAGSAAEVAGYVQQLANGTSRAAIAAGFVYSQENAQNTLNAMFAQYLQRPADPTADKLYLPDLEGASDSFTVAASILSSAEFVGRLTGS